MFKTNNQVHFCAYLTLWPPTLLQALSSRRFKPFLNTVLRTLLFTGLISLNGLAIAQEKPQPILPGIELQVASKTLRTELASTANQRYMGLSFRKSMAENEAMLFVFSAEQKLVFTMRNTLIPLSIAYISDDLVIQEILHMSVGPDQVFPSKAPARFALEVNQGWFKRNNVSIGTKISLGQ